MGIAQRLTVVKQHDTEPARSPTGRFTPNARSHGLPDAPQALRWGGVPAAKHPRKIAHHGPEPNFCTPFPTDGQVFSMQNPGRHTSAQTAPGCARRIGRCRTDAHAFRPPPNTLTLLRHGWPTDRRGVASCPQRRRALVRNPAPSRGWEPCPLPPAAPRNGNISVRMHPERPDSGGPPPCDTLHTKPDAPLTAQSLVILSQPEWWTFVTFGGQPVTIPSGRSRQPAGPAWRTPPFGRDFTRLQTRHTATGDARRMRPHEGRPRPAHHDATRSRTRSPRAPFQRGRNDPQQPPAPSFPRPAPHGSRTWPGKSNDLPLFRHLPLDIM